MRFLYKRPKMEQVQEELNLLMELMVSDLFIYLDLFVFSLIFTLLLSPAIHSLVMCILFFFVSFSIFSCFYYFIFSRIMKD